MLLHSSLETAHPPKKSCVGNLSHQSDGYLITKLVCISE